MSSFFENITPSSPGSLVERIERFTANLGAEKTHGKSWSREDYSELTEIFKEALNHLEPLFLPLHHRKSSKKPSVTDFGFSSLNALIADPPPPFSPLSNREIQRLQTFTTNYLDPTWETTDSIVETETALENLPPASHDANPLDYWKIIRSSIQHIRAFREQNEFEILSAMDERQKNEPNLPAVLELLGEIVDKNKQQLIRKAFLLIPPEERTASTLEAIISLIQTFVYDDDRPFEEPSDDICDILQKTPDLEKLILIRQLLPFATTISEIDTRKYFFYIATEVPQDKRTPSVLVELSLLFRGRPSNSQRKLILQTVHILLLGGITETIDQAAPLIEEIDSPLLRLLILQTIALIPPEQRSATLLQSVKNTFQSTPLTEAGTQDWVFYENCTIDATFPVDKKVIKFHNFFHIAKTFARIPVLRRTGSGFEGIRYLFQEDSIAKISNRRSYLLNTIPGELLPEGIELLSLFAEETSYPIDASVLPEIMKLLLGGDFIHLKDLREGIDQRIHVPTTDPVHTKDFIRKILSLCKGISDIEIRKDIFNFIKSSSEEERNYLSEESVAFFQSCSKEAIRTDILKAVLLIPRTDRTDLTLQFIKSLFENTPDPNMRIQVLIHLKNILPNERADILTKVMPLDDMDPDIVISTVVQLAPTYRSTAVQILRENPTLFTGNVLFNLLSLRQDLINPCHEYLMTALESLIADLPKIRSFATNIVENGPSLYLHNEHPLVQKALEINLSIRRMHGSNSKHPYRILGYLKTLVDEETPWMGPLPKSRINGKNFTINLQTIRQMPHPSFTGKDLPFTDAAERFDSLFAELQQRIDSTEGLSSEIEESYEHSFEELKNNLSGPIFRHLMRISEDLDRPIEDSTFYLYTILQAVAVESFEITEESRLSPRERALLNFSYLTITCKAGKVDGIASYYNDLPLELRNKRIVAQDASQERLRRAIDSSIQSVLRHTFSSEKLLQSLTERREISQKPHQILFLKNRLSGQIGLRHHLMFDFHSEMILDILFWAPLSRLMEKFFAFCLPEELVRAVGEDLNLSLKNPEAGTWQLLEPLLNESEGHYIFNEAVDEVHLTEQGALALLEHFGYLMPSSENEAPAKKART